MTTNFFKTLLSTCRSDPFLFVYCKWFILMKKKFMKGNNHNRCFYWTGSYKYYFSIILIIRKLSSGKMNYKNVACVKRSNEKI